MRQFDNPRGISIIMYREKINMLLGDVHNQGLDLDSEALDRIWYPYGK